MKRHYQFFTSSTGWVDFRDGIEFREVTDLDLLLVRMNPANGWGVYQSGSWRVKPRTLPGYRPDSVMVWFIRDTSESGLHSWLCQDGRKLMRVFRDGSMRSYAHIVQAQTNMDQPCYEWIQVNKVGDTE